MEKHPHSNIRIILDKMAARAGAAYKQLMARSVNLNLDSDPDPRTIIGEKVDPDPCTVTEEKVEPDLD